MSKSIIEVNDITYAIDEDDLNTYGDHDATMDALDLPETFTVTVDDADDDVNAVIQSEAEERFGVRLDDYNYDVIDEEDDDDDDFDEDDDECFADEDDMDFGDDDDEEDDDDDDFYNDGDDDDDE